MRTINLTATNIEFIFDELVKHISLLTEKEKLDMLIYLFKKYPGYYSINYIQYFTSRIIVDAALHFLLEYLDKDNFEGLNIHANFLMPLLKIQETNYTFNCLKQFMCTTPVNKTFNKTYKQQILPYFIEPCEQLYRYITLKNSVIKVNSNV